MQHILTSIFEERHKTSSDWFGWKADVADKMRFYVVDVL